MGAAGDTGDRIQGARCIWNIGLWPNHAPKQCLVDMGGGCGRARERGVMICATSSRC